VNAQAVRGIRRNDPGVQTRNLQRIQRCQTLSRTANDLYGLRRRHVCSNHDNAIRGVRTEKREGIADLALGQGLCSPEIKRQRGMITLLRLARVIPAIASAHCPSSNRFSPILDARHGGFGTLRCRSENTLKSRVACAKQRSGAPACALCNTFPPRLQIGVP
jgi:hypothetical protein